MLNPDVEQGLGSFDDGRGARSAECRNIRQLDTNPIGAWRLGGAGWAGVRPLDPCVLLHRDLWRSRLERSCRPTRREAEASSDDAPS